ncbi:tRNA (adenosine(37)-N6)-dimethylallyltransferase MiaA [Candidatus Wolfebacteria bacterium]|nr:MAG: tRNA (adenosine(37)-N6)-dimethylallyltransferase MiaA [Candidatus Wolfebacteria bacterium]
MHKLITILGPTASGKSGLAIELAKKYNGEVISADSRQVYRGLDIGTGKVTAEEMDGVPHHLLDVVNPEDQFTVVDFKKLADKAIGDIVSRGKIPILAGGTGFYIDSVVKNIIPPEVPPNEELRNALEEKSLEELNALLLEKDPARHSMIDIHNKRRIIRALEIIEDQGSVPPIESNPQYNVLQLGIQVDEEVLRKKIMDRLLSRIDDGMIEETRQLHEQGLSYERMDSLGLEYRFLAKLLKEEITHEEFVTLLHTAICQYAKRQRTYFRRDENIKWFGVSQTMEVEEVITAFLKK